MYLNIPSSLIDLAFQQLVKGCKMAMHNAAILAEENRQLRAENARQKRKRAIKRSFIQSGGVLTVQEGIELVETAKNRPMEGEEEPHIQPQRCALGRCSICGSTVHNARKCLART
jgi:hypothetical protein